MGLYSTTVDTTPPTGLPSADPYEITWRLDESISSGVYLVRVTMEDRRTVSKRVVYLK